MTKHRFQRNTRQREVILAELCKLTSHPTAVGLHEIVKLRLPKISLGTVYRNLELLRKMGAVRKLQFSEAEARFDGNVEPHDHVRCIRCGRVDDVHGSPLELNNDKDHDCRGCDCRGYQILGHRLEWFGVCPQCSQHDADEKPTTSTDEPQ